MLNVVRGPIYDSRLSIQNGDDYNHGPNYYRGPRARDDRMCGCWYQRNLKIARERERIKQFSIWFAEVDKFKQEEYIKRRRKWRLARMSRERRMWKIRTLLIPAGLLLLTGCFLILASYLQVLGLWDSLLVHRQKLLILGGVVTGLSVVVFMVEQGLLSHYQNKFGIKIFTQFRQNDGRDVTNNLVSEHGDSGNTFVFNNQPNSSENEDTLKKNIHQFDSFDTNASEDTTELLSEKDPLVPKKQQKRPPKLSEIAAKKRGMELLRSVDTTVSVLTEITMVTGSDPSICSEPLGPLPDAAVGGVSEHQANFMIRDDDKDTLTLNSSNSGESSMLLH